MKKIINGKMYNTETAKALCCWDNGFGCGDFQHAEETLYKKRTGEFFLFGEGGAMSKYAQPDGNGWCGGSEIEPLTEAEARKWAEKKATADEYIAIFGEVEE